MCIMYMSSLDIELAYITFSNLKSLCLRSTPVQPQMFVTSSFFPFALT